MNLDELMETIEQQEDVEVFSGLDLSTPEKRQAYRIEDDTQCDRVLSWYNKKQEIINHNIELAKQAKKAYDDKINAWLEHVNKPYENSNNFYSYIIEEYMANKFNGKKGTLKLFNGDIKYFQPKDTIEYEDEENIIKWLEENNYKDYIRVTTNINKVDLKKAAKQKGTTLCIDDKPIPGISFIPQEMKLTISPLKQKKEVTVDDVPFL